MRVHQTLAFLPEGVKLLLCICLNLLNRRTVVNLFSVYEDGHKQLTHCVIRKCHAVISLFGVVNRERLCRVELFIAQSDKIGNRHMIFIIQAINGFNARVCDLNSIFGQFDFRINDAGNNFSRHFVNTAKCGLVV